MSRSPVLYGALAGLRAAMGVGAGIQQPRHEPLLASCRLGGPDSPLSILGGAVVSHGVAGDTLLQTLPAPGAA